MLILIKEIFLYYKRINHGNGKSIIILFFLQLFTTIIFNIIPLYSQIFLDKIIPQKKLSLIIWFSCLILLTSLVTYTSQFIFNILCNRAKLRLAYSLDNKVFNSILNAKFSVLNKKPASYMANRIKADVANIVSCFEFYIGNLTCNLVTAIWALSYVFTVNVWLFLTIVFIILPVTKFYRYYYNKYKEKIANLRDINAEIDSFRYETLAGLKVLKLFRALKYRMNIYQKKYKAYEDESISITKIEAVPGIVEDLLFNEFPAFLVFLVGGYLLYRTDITIGEWMALLIYSSIFLRPASSLGKSNGVMIKNKNTIDRLNDYLNLPQEENESSQAVVDTIRCLEFKEISFSYPDNTKALSSINLSIDQVGVWAIMGYSGSGKSTLGGIIAGMFEPQEGTFNINGIDSKLFNVDYIREKITLVNISDYIFSESIKDNIIFANAEASEIEFDTAMELSCSKNFIDELEMKSDTLLGQHGFGLSDGQKQRLLLARAFIKSGDVIIFDETTASLDSNTEKVVLENIVNHFKGKIIIFITHHPSVAKLADKIILIRDGKIDSTGTEAELSSNNDYFKEMITRGKKCSTES